MAFLLEFVAPSSDIYIFLSGIILYLLAFGGIVLTWSDCLLTWNLIIITGSLLYGCLLLEPIT
jgi:hypothetical protein